MEEKIFAEYVRCGLGRAVTFLRAASPSELEKHRAAVLDCCIHNYAYDVQSEGTREQYRYDLASCYPDVDYFVVGAITALDGADDDIGWEFHGLVRLLSLFGRRGHANAADALRRRYSEVYPMLTRPPRRRRRIVKVDNTAEHYEDLCVALCELDGLDGFIKVASDLGRLFGASNYDADWFGYVLTFCEDKFGKDVVRERLKAESATDEYVAAYLTSAEITIKPIIPLPPEERAARDAEFKRKIEEKLLKSALAFLEETDEQRKDAFLLECYDSYPLDPAPVIECARSGGKSLRSTALSVLSNIVGPAVREFALELIREGRELDHALSMLISNYTEADASVLIETLKNNKFDDGRKHLFCLKIVEECEAGRRLPFEALEYVYYYCCGHCRMSAVKLMAERGNLPVELARECLYDCNPSLREYAAGLDID